MGTSEVRNRMDLPGLCKEGVTDGPTDEGACNETKEEDIADRYRPIVDIIGVDAFVELSIYACGDELYFPKPENIVAPARNRRVKKEYNGYNLKELAEKYNLTTVQIRNILKDEPMIGQMSIFDMENEQKST